ncbi:unnamed protein product [Chironomus riparius]|uniref:BPTI/Kunitz inhibitor domain-containing protein n=1 Tax=Chironomus riparius TaxID=315576 RepID=A0A9N9RU51_9DIPT|nr:unnamed protein product [Chironomus riparius]
MKLLFLIFALFGVIMMTSGQDCHSSPDPGPCDAHFIRYTYNPSSKSCSQFIYGGCAGNSNNFHTNTQCMSSCGGH